MLRFYTTLLLAATCLLVNAGLTTDKVTTCGGSNIHRLSCDVGVISIQTAFWGRADSVTCSDGKPLSQIVNTACSLTGAVDLLRRRCDGKRVCEVNPNLVATSDPCFGTHKYMQTTYTCLLAIRQVICEQSLAHLQCAEGQVISVFSADYGRHDQTTCSYKRPGSQVQNTDCSHPTNKVAESCNGKNSCTIKASGSLFGDPCFGTYKYLEVAYVCDTPVTTFGAH